MLYAKAVTISMQAIGLPDGSKYDPIFKKWANPGLFLFIFVLFTFQFKWQIYNLNNMNWK